MVFIFLALLTGIVSFLLAKKFLNTKVSEKTNSTAYAGFMFFFGGVFAFIFYILTSIKSNDLANIVSIPILLIILLDVFLWAIGAYFYWPAFKKIPASEATIAISLEGFFAFIIGLILQTDSFLPLRLVGGLLIFISIFFLIYKKGELKINIHSLRIFISTIFFGAAVVIDNLIITHGFVTIFFLLIWNYCLTGILLFLFGKNSHEEFKVIIKHKKILITAIVNGFLSFVSFFFTYKAYQSHITASQATMILSSETVFIVLLSTLFLGEKEHFYKKLLASLIASIGVYLLS